MTISKNVRNQFFAEDSALIRLEPTVAQPSRQPTRRPGTPWSLDEHDRFLQALEQFPNGPWKVIAEHVGTRSTRQTMTHAQKYREKIARQKRSVEEKNIALARQQQFHKLQAQSSAAVISTVPCGGQEVPLASAVTADELLEWLDDRTCYDIENDWREITISDELGALLETYEPLDILPDVLFDDGIYDYDVSGNVPESDQVAV